MGGAGHTDSLQSIAFLFCNAPLPPVAVFCNAPQLVGFCNAPLPPVAVFCNAPQLVGFCNAPLPPVAVFCNAPQLVGFCNAPLPPVAVFCNAPQLAAFNLQLLNSLSKQPDIPCLSPNPVEIVYSCLLIIHFWVLKNFSLKEYVLRMCSL